MFALSRGGRIESTTYRTVKIPSDVDVPLYIKDEFGPFYKAVFERTVSRENMHAVLVEYAWDMGWCDPCAGEPLSNKELVELGARWQRRCGRVRRWPLFAAAPTPSSPAKTFPEDIMLMETRDRTNSQGRYVPRHPCKGTASCEAANT